MDTKEGGSAVTDRKYAMTKIAAGDYILPSNDAQTIWRIQRYTDGPSFGLVDWPRDRELWSVARWTGKTGPGCFIDTSLESTRWEEVGTSFSTRREAIEYAMAAENAR